MYTELIDLVVYTNSRRVLNTPELNKYLLKGRSCDVFIIQKHERQKCEGNKAPLELGPPRTGLSHRGGIGNVGNFVIIFPLFRI